MARVFEWGTAPKAVGEGYRFKKVLFGTEAELTKKYAGQDVILVCGCQVKEIVFPFRIKSEFALYVKDESNAERNKTVG